MTTKINGDTGVSQCQPNSVSQDDLQANVVGKGPAFAAKHAVQQSFAFQQWTVAIFGSELLDTNNAYDPATGIFTAPVSGWYQCDWFIEFASSTNTVTLPGVFSNVLKNNVTELAGGSTAIGGNGSVTAGSGLAQCSVGDQLKIRGYQENSGAVAVGATGRFSAHLVRAA